MALIDRQVRDRIVSRGLGNSGEGNKGNEEGVVSLTVPIKAFVYKEELYYPTTGTVSVEEDINGWFWDRTTSQEYSIENFQNEITDHIGGYQYNLLEGTSDDDYRGSVSYGCELKEIRKLATKDSSETWQPVINTGSYSVKGIEKPLYSSSGINKCFISSSKQPTNTLDLSSYEDIANLDNVVVAIYKRDENFVKAIFREYKEEGYLYKYSLNVNNEYQYELSTVDSRHFIPVGGDAIGDDASQTQYNRLETVGYYTQGSKNSFYTTYFPICNVEVFCNASDKALIPDHNIIIDHDLGIITIKDHTKGGEVRVRYKAVPRVDFEIDPEIGFKGNFDLKSHNYIQSNGIIEISTEERHVSQIILSRNPAAGTLKYGEDSLQLNAEVLDSKQNFIDEIKVTFKCLDTNQEIRFEGNLLEISSESNKDGRAFTRINAPLSDEASSYFFPGEYTDGFDIPQDELVLDAEVQTKAIIFEVLACDPFYGSKGITLDISSDIQEDVDGNYYFEVETNLESQDYKLFRNALTKTFVDPVNSSISCFDVFYNGGFLVGAGLAQRYIKIPIKNITKDRIYVHGEVYIRNFEQHQLILFRKNSNHNRFNEPKGVERVLYEKDEAGGYKLLRPQRTTNGKLVYNNIQNRQNDDLAVGYRVYVPRKTRVQASCVDPATGLTIYSNELEIKVELPDIYKSEIHFDNSDENTDIASNLNTMNFISYDPVENNFYFKAEEP